MTTLNLKPISKDKKGDIMKTTILAIGIIMVLLCMPQITTKAAAQQSGYFTAMAISSLAEKEAREKDKLAEVNCEIRTAQNTVAADDEERAVKDVKKE
jgi:hypothetical protein